MDAIATLQLGRAGRGEIHRGRLVNVKISDVAARLVTWDVRVQLELRTLNTLIAAPTRLLVLPGPSITV